MDNLLTINLDETSIEFEYAKKYELNGNNDFYTFEILSTKDEKYNKLITNYNLIRKHLEESYNECDLDLDTFKEYKKFLSNYINKDNNFYKKLIDNIEFIKISGNFVVVKDYIEKNPILKTKKILLDDKFDLEYDTSLITNLFKDYDNIYVEILGNDLPIKIEELNKTQNIIKGIVNEIKQYNFSPIEQIMYLYDKVRERKYVKEGTNDSYTESRDLTKVLTGDKIVCVGYANIIDSVLKMLNISTFMNYLKHKNKNIGHVLNVVYVKDDKYNINGIFYFDATWDSKRNDTNNYLYSYKYFAKNKNIIEQYQKHQYNNVELNGYTNNMVDNFIETVNTIGLESLDRDIRSTINILSRLVFNDSLIKPLMYKDSEIAKILNYKFDMKDVINKVKYLDNLLKQEIDSNIMLKILYNVRKIEYYKEPNKFAFDIYLICNAIYNSDWLYDEKTLNLFNAIFGKDYIINKVKEYGLKNYYKTNMGLNIERIRLTKTLRNVYESKKHN